MVRKMRKIIIWMLAVMILIYTNSIAEQFTLTMSGHSMDPTLSDNDVVLFDDSLNPHRNDIVLCEYPNRSDVLFIKRVVGVPGDRVYRKNEVTHVVYEYLGKTNDIALDGRYSDYFPNGSPNDYNEYTLENNEYFVIGDNVYNSHDSRDWKDDDPEYDVGPLGREKIVAVAIGKLEDIK